jgi:hypothetical protein
VFAVRAQRSGVAVRARAGRGVQQHVLPRVERVDLLRALRRAVQVCSEGRRDLIQI